MPTRHIKLKNGQTEVILDANGSIISVANSVTEHVYFKATETDRRLFQVIAPNSTWASRSLDSHKCVPPVITKNADGYTFRYENMEQDGWESGITTEVCFKKSSRTDEIQLSLQIFNNGEATVTGATFPWLNGWRNSSAPLADIIMLGPNMKVDPSEFPKWCMAWGNGTMGQEATTVYPTTMMLPWVDYSGEAGGVSCINYQREARQFYAATKNIAAHDPGQRMGVLFGFYAYAAPGSTWQSPEFGISVHDGDWHQTADRYRKWMNNELLPPNSQNRVLRESIGSEQVFFSSFDGAPVRPYESLPEIARFARECGVRECCVWDRETLGVYASTNSGSNDLLQYSDESRNRLSRAVRQAVEAGSDVSALVNFRLIGSGLDVFKKENYIDEVQQALDGTAKIENWSGSGVRPGYFWVKYLGPYCNMFSPWSEKYRNRIKKHIQAYLDLGYTSLFYDQPFETDPDYSQKDSGGVPELTYAQTLEIVKEVREQIRKTHPDALLMGEQCDVFGTEVIDQWMTWAWSNADLAGAIRMHYALPRTVFNCVIDRELGLASHAFAAGLNLFLMTKAGTGTLADAPELAKHVRRLATLRKRCAERTVHGRFCHTTGLSIETNDGIVAYSYDSDRGPAVIIAAPEKAGAIKVDVDTSFFFATKKSDKGRLYRLDGAETEVLGDAQTFDLEQYEVIIWTV